MRAFYPFLSQEINDTILESYSHYVYLLGYDDVNGNTTYSGLYDTMETSLDIDSSKYAILRNDYSPNNTSLSKKIDSVQMKINLRRA